MTAARLPLRPPLRRFLATLATALPLACLGLAAPAGAAVVISQVYGGGGNSGATLKHDFIELFNNGSAPVAIGGWSVQYASATGTSWALTPIPAGTTLQPGRYLLVRQAQGTGGSIDVIGDVTGTLAMGGVSGKVALANNSTAFSGTVPTGAVDFVGYGAATTAEGSPTALLTSTTSAQRNTNGCTDSNNNFSDFTVALAAPRNSTSPASLCGGAPANQPIVATCPAASVAAGSAALLSTSATDADSLVTSASAAGAWPAGFSLGSFTAANAAGGTATQTLNVAANTTPGAYTLGLQWANSDAQTASCSFTVTIAGITPIYSIQGSGAKSPFEGQTVVTSGVVTLVNNNGFFLQDPVGDGNPLTSDGLFVFTSTAPTVSAGQRIQLSGQVAEFNTGATSGRTVTELVSPTGISVLGSGDSVVPTVVSLPVAVDGDLERHEGMLVTLSGPFTVAQNFFQGRFGQLTLAAGGRLETPTNRHRPGAQAAALADANVRRTILLDDGASTQNPNPIPYLASGARAGDTTGAITGVIDYGLATSSNPGLGLYKIHPLAAPVFASGNPRTAAPGAVGGNLKVASFNVLNYFTAYTNGGGTANGCSLGGATSTANCRGANNAAEFTRQQTKIVEAMAAIDADVLGLMEIQNNGNTAALNLVAALNARVGAGTYVTTSLPTDTGDDAIRVAMIYKPARLSPVGAAVSDTHAINNRPTLAQTFSLANGEKFTLLVNHLKSKGSCPATGAADYNGNFNSGDGQGCWNLLRTQQAQRLHAFVAERLTATQTTDALLIGDLNAYGQEDPIAALTGSGYADQVQRFNAFGYSYVFDGGAGRLDHALANTALAAKVNRVVHWHINADEAAVTDYNTEFKAPALTCGAGGSSPCPADPYTATPYRSSDHDPVVVGLNLYNKAWAGTSGADVITAAAGDDLVWASVGADLLTGGAGSNGFAYRSMREAGGSITDFVPGKDRIDLSALLASINTASSTAVGRGVVKLVAAGGNTLLQIDTDGSAGPVLPRTLVTLRNVSPASIVPRRDLGLN
jgi:predicted extracellular nuclease